MDIIEKARYAIVCENVFWTVMMGETKFVQTDQVKTAATDGKSIFYNPDYVKGLTRLEAMGLIIHELYHPLSEHLWRRGNRDHKQWNIAADLSINPMILEDGWHLPKGALIDSQYAGKRAEIIYAMREQEKDKNNIVGDDAMTQQFDDNELGDMIEAPEMSDEQKDQAIQEIRQRVAMAATMAEQAGQMEGALERLVKEILNPPVSLEEELERLYSNVVPEDDEDWSRRDSRIQDFYAPSYSTERMGPVVVIGDTSGSVTDRDIQRCVGAIDILMSTVNPEQIIVVWWDHGLQHIEVLEQGDPIVLHPKGGGGTRMDAALEYVSNNYTPEAVIMVTDCETPWPKQEPEYPLIVLSTSSRTSPIGSTIHIKDFA